MEYPVFRESGFRGPKKVYIKNPDQFTDAYHVDFRTGFANMVIRRGNASGPVVGRIDFRCWSRATDIAFEDNSKVEMRSKSTFSEAQAVMLPAAPGPKNFLWKPTSTVGKKRVGGHLKLVDEQGQVLATFTRSAKSKMDGTVRIEVGGLRQEFLDQIFVSFMAVDEKQRKSREAAAAAAAS